MWQHTYFVMSPGFDRRSFIEFSDEVRGNYVKFGDEVGDHGALGIRNAYSTHNPDIGVAAVMATSAFQDPGLGTRLKRFIALDLRIRPVGNTEWFGVVADAAHALFGSLMQWDRATVDAHNLDQLLALLRRHLTVDTTFVPAGLETLQTPGPTEFRGGALAR